MSKMKFPRFLKDHYIKQGESYTHTRMKNEAYDVTGGSYVINKGSDLDNFYSIYWDHVFTKRQKEYLTERQLQTEESPIMIDLDFRYTTDVTCRLHDDEFTQQLIFLYLEKLHDILIFREDTNFPVMVFHKPNIKMLDDKTKDGIHIIIGVQLSRPLQKYLRKQVIDSFSEISGDLPFTNSHEDIFDEGITTGKTNWTLYGSQKADSEAYKLTHLYNVDAGDFASLTSEDTNAFVSNFDNFKTMSAQYSGHIHYDVKPEFVATITSNERNGRPVQELTPALYQLGEGGYGIERYLGKIRTIDDIKKIVGQIFQENLIRSDDYVLKETHDMTMILPETYYNPYDKWVRVGWALRNTDFRLFFTWILFSSQSASFDINDIPTRYTEWCGFKEGVECLSYRSITLWAKTHYNEVAKTGGVNLYSEIVEKTVAYHVTQSIISGGVDFDLAMVMFQRYKDDYRCAHGKNNIWYKFEDNHWVVIEGGVELNYIFSTKLHRLYYLKSIEILNKLNTIDKANKDYDMYEKQLEKVSAICIKLKDSNKKSGIFKAAKEIFYDRNFVHMIDKNPNLMVFKNGVIDFKAKEFRAGRAEDYITLTTGIEYKPLSYYQEHNSETIDDITYFMKTLFPLEDVNKYMWQFLASSLIGTNLNHKFRIFMGCGSNGKSILVKLMSKILGPYQGSLLGNVISQKRIGTGNASPEIMALQGVRLAVIQEPSKNEKLNDGPMKELTGGDPITGRKLYQDQVTYEPQFDLIVCANNLYDIEDTSEGTWRRIDLIHFISKFVDNVDDPKYKNQKHIFPKDKFLDLKFDAWKEIFISMLINITFETGGLVDECKSIKDDSFQYEASQNSVLNFITTSVRECEGSNIKITGLWREYQLWIQTHGDQKPLKQTELKEKMNKMYGDYGSSKCWKNVKHVLNEANDEMEDEEDEA